MPVPADNAVPVAAPRVPIRDVLGRVGHELAHLARMLDQLQVFVAPSILEAAGKDPRLLHQIQSLDHIVQKVAALSDFLAALGPTASGHWLVDPAEAARVVTLAELAARLGFLDDGDGSCATAGGDFELF